MGEKTNRVLAKILLTLILIVVVAGGISLIADGQTDGFGTVFVVFIMIVAVFGFGRAIIER